VNALIVVADATPTDARREVDDWTRYVRARKTATISTAVGGALFAAGMAAGAVFELQCAQQDCDTQGFGLAGIVFGAWGTIVPMTVAGVELARMNQMRRDNGAGQLTSAWLVLPSTGLTLGAFALYPLDPPADGVAAIVQVGGASIAIVSAVIAVAGTHPPFADEPRVGFRLEPLREGGAVASVGGSW
jgi:hypothetical protein